MICFGYYVSTEKKQQMMKRRDTRLSFDDSRDALKRFESFVPPQPQVYEDSADDSQEDEGQCVCVNFLAKINSNSYTSCFFCFFLQMTKCSSSMLVLSH